MSDLASKKLRLDSEQAGLEHLINCLNSVSVPASSVKSLSQLSDIASLFSDPAFNIKLLFPSSLPKRFEIDFEHKWFLMGRENFADLLKEFQSHRWGVDRSALWIYGTKGYGKSHLLAALVGLLIAQNE
jgi:hypothetical protein